MGFAHYARNSYTDRLLSASMAYVYICLKLLDYFVIPAGKKRLSPTKNCIFTPKAKTLWPLKKWRQKIDEFILFHDLCAKRILLGGKCEKLSLHTVRNLHFLSKNSTLISRENCRFFGWKTRENVLVLSNLNFWTKFSFHSGTAVL